MIFEWDTDEAVTNDGADVLTYTDEDDALSEYYDEEFAIGTRTKQEIDDEIWNAHIRDAIDPRFY